MSTDSKKTPQGARIALQGATERAEDAQLLEDLKAYQGDDLALLASALAVRITEHPELAQDEREFIKLNRTLPESAQPAMRAVIVLSAGHGTKSDRETLRLWIEQQEQRGRSVLSEIRKLASAEEHT